MAIKSLSAQQPPLLKEALPTMYDLPSEEKEEALRKAQQASEKAQQLEAKLRELGVDPDRT